ncbi:MAG: fibronectin type III domain-containing protein, partial [Lentisphaeria bacterium]|nr:fibronectin type III domain-containing protein [Lentisphaeria bacterium]
MDKTAVSGLLFTVPQEMPDAGMQENVTKYSAWIGWIPADDGKDGSGIRSYDITFTASGNTETVTVLKDDLYGYSTASWKADNLQQGNYRVRINGKNVAAWLSSDGSAVEWKTDSNLNGAVVTVMYEVNGQWTELQSNIKGTDGEPAVGEYTYSFIPGKTFAEWTLKGSGNTGGLDSAKVYEVYINGTLCADAALRSIDGKLRLTWTIDGNFIEADTATQIEIKEDGVVIYDSTNNAHRISDSFEKSYTYYECVWQVTGITDKNLHYTISATDFCNNVTNDRESLEGSILVDTGAPKFPGSYTATWGSPETDANGEIKISPAFSWQPAVDSDGDLGIRYYELYINVNPVTGEAGWTLLKTFSQEEVVRWNEGDQSKPLYQLDGSIDWNEYKYKIVAYDYFGNSTAVEDTFGTPDHEPPVGEFTHEFTSSVSAAWAKTKLRVFEVGEDGGLIDDENDKTGYKTKLIETRGELKSASVTLTWGDIEEPDFTDKNKIYYRVTVANYIGEHESLTNPDYESYDFWTTSTSITFDNKTPGRPVGIFESWDNVYWCVTVYDEYYNGGASSNESSLKSDWYEFKFAAVDTNTYNAGADNEHVLVCNESGALVSYDYSEVRNQLTAVKNSVDVIDETMCYPTKVGMTSVPTDIKAEYAWEAGREAYMENSKRAGTAAITWKQDAEVLGVYEYEITLSNAFHTYTARTTDADRKGADTDLAKAVSYNASTRTFKIADLSKFLGIYNIPDGDYLLTVTALDTNGRKIKSSAFDFHMDTTAPDEVKSITIDNVADNVNNEKYFEAVLNWKTPDGGSDIAYYEVKYRIVVGDGELENNWTVKQVNGNSCVLPSIAEGVEYEFYILAVDTAGNRSVASKQHKTKEGFSLSDEPYPDTVGDALTR